MAFALQTTLARSLAGGDTRLFLPAADHQALCTQLSALGQGAILEISQGHTRERVLAVSCADEYIVVRRGWDGTSPSSFSLGACICFIRYEDVCDAPDPNCDPCVSPNPWDLITIGDGLELDRTDPGAPVLRLKAVLSAPGEYGGAAFNQYGQLTSAPRGWPASALPVFDPCACADGGTSAPGDVSAGQVSFVSCGFTGATNVQDALCHLEQWASGLSFDTGVMSVSVGDGLQLSGTATHPVISLAPVSITPGNYAGFDVNQYGQIVGYTPVSVDHPQHVSVAPLRVSFDNATNTWTHMIDWADYTQPGVVQFVSVGDIQNDTVPAAQEEWAITYEGANALVDRKIAALGTAQFDISALPVSTTFSDTDLLAIYNITNNQHESVTIRDILDLAPIPTVLLEYDPASGTTGVQLGVTSVVTTAPGVHTITLDTPLSGPTIHATIRGDSPLAKVTVEVSTSTTIVVRTYNLDVVGGTLSATAADHPFYLTVHSNA